MKRGVRSLSNDKLVALLGISTKTIYKHFKDKEDLLDQALDLFYAQQNDLFHELPKDESAPVLLFRIWTGGFEMEFNVNKKFFQELLHYYPELVRNAEMRNVQQIWREFAQIINRGIKEGDLVSNIKPEAALESIAVLYVSTVRKGDFQKFSLSPYEIFENSIGLFLRGLCTPKGLRKLDRHMANFKIPEKQKAGRKRLAFAWVSHPIQNIP